MTIRAFLAAAALLLGAAPAAQAQTADAALDSLRARVDARPGDTDARRALAARLVEAGRQPEAITAYEAVLESEALPDDARLDVWRRLAQLYSWNERPDDALTAYERIAELAPGDLDVRRALAQRYFWAERPREGIRQLEDLLARQPEDLDARRQLAQQYLWTDRPEEALTQYEALLERRPEDPEVVGQVAQQYLWNGRTEEAAALYRRLVEQRPDSTNARLSLGKALAWSGRPDEALPVLEGVLREQPDQAEALLLAGEIQRWGGDWRAGRARLRRVRALDPGNARAEELLRGLRRQYGPQAEAQYRYLSDSNDLVVQRAPLAFRAVAVGAWEVEAHLGYTRFTDEDETLDALAVDDEVRGYEASVEVARVFGVGTRVAVHGGGASYSTGWAPLSVGAEVRQSLPGGVTIAGRYDWSEVQGGVAALGREIRAHTASLEGYAQATTRLAFSALGQYTAYSDDNGRTTAYAGASYQVLQSDPGLALTAAYSYDGADTIYETSIPYWTPDALSTVSARAALTQTFFGGVRVGAGGGAALQEGEVSSIFNASLGVEDARFHTVEIAYERSGSSAYSSDGFTARYAYRF